MKKTKLAPPKNRYLTIKQRFEIRKSSLSTAALSLKYNISRRAIQKIRSRPQNDQKRLDKGMNVNMYGPFVYDQQKLELEDNVVQFISQAREKFPRTGIPVTKTMIIEKARQIIIQHNESEENPDPVAKSGRFRMNYGLENLRSVTI